MHIKGNHVKARKARIEHEKSKKHQTLQKYIVNGVDTSRTYYTWQSMIARCSNPKQVHYHGRGIMVCKRWYTFENFLEDMGLRPLGKTLDRKNVNGHYTRDNCKWSTYKEQANNRRSKADPLYVVSLVE
jgi:hypothetical protein